MNLFACCMATGLTCLLLGFALACTFIKREPVFDPWEGYTPCDDTIDRIRGTLRPWSQT